MNKKNTHSLLEYETNLKNSFNEFKLTSRELKEIEKLNNLYKTNLFEFIPNGIKAKQFVGIIQIGKKTIEVLPKIFTEKNNLNDDKDETSLIRKNLLYMLSLTKKLKIKETEISNISKNDNLFEIFIYLFSKNLLELLKQDLIRNYETKEENTNFLKGKLLMAKHLRYNLFNKAKFYSQFDEFTEDNLLNQIFKATINKLIPLTKNNKNFKLLSECDFILQDVRLKNINLNDCNRIIFNRLNLQYEPSFNLAKLLLFGNSIELNSNNLKTYSLMFNMNVLFEEFIFEFIKRNFLNDYKIIKSQKKNKFVFEQVSKNFTKFQLRPDIYLEKKSKDILIIDTKYKKLNKSKSNYGVSQGDIYQMFLYGMKYFNEQEIKNIILLYPKYEFSVNSEKISLNSKENINIKIKTINLHLDLIIKKDNLIKELNEILNITIKINEPK